MPQQHSQAAQRVTPNDSLEYLSDMMQELEGLAVRAGFPTLAGILALAFHEAELQLRSAELNRQA